MKKMMRMAMMAAAMFVAVTTVARAQDPQQMGGRRGGGRMGMNIVQLLKDSLHVSDDVAAKADSIVKASQAEMMEARQSAGDDRQAMMQKMGEIRTKQNDAIKALLTDDQKAAFDKLTAGMGRGRRGGGL